MAQNRKAGQMVRSMCSASAVALATFAWAAPAEAQTAPSPFTSATRYDPEGRIVGTIAPDPDGTGPLHHLAVRNTYNDAGDLVKVEKGELQGWQDEGIAPAAWSGFAIQSQVETSYDLMGRKVLEVTSGPTGTPKLTATQWSYNDQALPECTAERMNPAAYGSLPGACTLGPQGSFGPDRITRNQYDAAGQLLVAKKAVGTALQQDYVTYSYTANGKQASVTDANGNRAELSWDGFDRQARWTFPSKTAGGQVDPADYEAYAYDSNGNRTNLRKRDGVQLTYQYDPLNRMTVKSVPGSASGAAGYSVYYGYDLGGLQTFARFGSASGSGVTHTFDGFGQLTASTTTMGGVSRTVTSDYDPDGNRVRITQPDGVYFTTVYDGADRAMHADWWSPALGTVPFMQITYDVLGRRLDINRASSYTGYAYDPVGRLGGQNQRFAGNTGNVTTGFSYNPASQIAQETRDNDSYTFTGSVNVDRPYTVNGLNQYTSAGSTGFGYDANGNLSASGSTSYIYDAENRLVGASTSNGTTLTYDPLGRLWQTASPVSGKTQFVYDGDHVAVEYDGDTGGIRRRYMWGPGADEPILQDEGGQMNCSGTRFLHTNHQGSIVAVADCGGGRTNVNSYDEYGIPSASNWGRFQYTGQAWVPELGMYYYKARFYSPTLGRFMQTDPIGYEDQVNLYAYVANDPVNGRDPTGESCQTDKDGRPTSCQIDQVATIDDGKRTVRPITDADRSDKTAGPQIALAETALTAASQAAFDDKGGVTVPLQGTTATIPWSEVAGNLINLPATYSPSDTHGRMWNDGREISVNGGTFEKGLGKEAVANNFLHEGAHNTPTELREFRALRLRPDFNAIHQGPYLRFRKF